MWQFSAPIVQSQARIAMGSYATRPFLDIVDQITPGIFSSYTI
jgi:hypothetical protein